MQRWSKRSGAVVCLAMASCVWLSGSTALAVTPEDPVRTQARALAYAGVKAYSAADYQTAHEKLEESFKLLAVPTLGLWSARALVKVGKLVEAARRYEGVSRLEVGPSDPPVQRSAKIDASRERQDLVARIPTLSFRFSGVRPDQVTLMLDGVPVVGLELGRAQRVNPGRHEAVGTHGSEKTVVIMDLVEGQHEEIWLRFAEPSARVNPAPVTEAAPVQQQMARTTGALRTAGWVALAVGGASVATGVVAYLVSRADHADLERLGACSSPSCSAESLDAYRSYQNWRTLHVVALLSGGLMGAAGVTLLVAGHAASDAAVPTDGARVGLTLGFASAVVFGRF
jgi:hypothetical protein